MDGCDLHRMIDRVKQGRLSRRGFIRRMALAGLTAPMATQLLAIGGVAMAQSPSSYKPTKAGGGGTLKLLWWQGPTLLNPHFAVGTKDQDGSGLFYEPLAGWDPAGNLRLMLAAEIPSIENGGLAKDGTSMVWKLKQGVKWHDGEPFTADDVVFNWAYARDPATAAVTAGSYNRIKVEKVDQHTVRILFPSPTPFWADAFVGANGMLIPKHLFEPYIGSKSRAAPNNLKPVGTGPYKFKSFNPGDLVTGVINTDYHRPNRPYFDAIEMKGGGDATSAARAVLQTGEYDYAWNLQVEDDVLKRLEGSGHGRATFVEGSGIEHIQINFTDPWKEVDGERASIKTVHPTLSDPKVRQALSLLVDRSSVQKYIYGRAGVDDCELPHRTGALRLQGHVLGVQHQEGDRHPRQGRLEAGARRHPRERRQQAEIRVPDLDQPAAAGDAADHQAGLPEGRHRNRPQVGRRIGLFLLRRRQQRYLSEILYRPADVRGLTRPNLIRASSCSSSCRRKWRARRTSGRAATSRAGATRTTTASTRQRPTELDPVKRAALFMKLNDLVIDNVVVIPVIFRKGVSGAVNGLHASLSGWDDDTRDLADWYKTA